MKQANTQYISEKSQAAMAKVFADLDMEPRKFDMGGWGIAVKDSNTLLQLLASEDWLEGEEELKQLARTNPPCGTIDCLAGQTLVTLGGLKPKTKIGRKGYYLFPENTPEKAQKLLGLTEDQASNLFYPEQWPAQFCNSLDRLKPGTKEYLEVTKKRWQHMVETGE